MTYSSYDDYPAPIEEQLWPDYSKERTIFRLWSPQAETVRINFYKNGHDGDAYEQHELESKESGVWEKTMPGDLNGIYYTFQIRENGQWLEETPGIYAQAVGVNGNRAMVIDLSQTNPAEWDSDKGPKSNTANEAIIYEVHVRDFTIHESSGAEHKGKFIGMVEENTSTQNGVSTGIQHLKELGVTHVHLLPSFDHYSIDETKLDTPQFNWGYDPQNYNVPEGSYSTDPFNAEVRIKEFKEMVKKFHDAGIGVILDVVYNHTGKTKEANFNQEAPGYYYRQWEDGKWSDASACGNETASERAMARKYIVESVAYWMKEYHLDGFRFDLMGIHDIETMNAVANTVKAINPNALVYGEGWTAGDSPLPIENRALKANTYQMPMVAAFSDDIRDGIKGSVFEDESTGFVSGASGMEESIKFGIVGSIDHPQIDNKAVNYSDQPWANEPWQTVSYVSCHDNHTLYDKLKISQPNATEEEIAAMHRLANAIVLTSQGISFLHAGVEMMRTKNGEHNSYNLPDEINQIDWNAKSVHQSHVNYYKALIALRKNHKAFYMPSADSVRNYLEFFDTPEGVVAYTIDGAAVGDTWNKILVVYNAQQDYIKLSIEGNWKVVANGSEISQDGLSTSTGQVEVKQYSMLIAHQ